MPLSEDVECVDIVYVWWGNCLTVSVNLGYSYSVCVSVRLRVRVRACVRASVRACVRECVFACVLFDGYDGSLVHSCNVLERSEQHGVERIMCGLYCVALPYAVESHPTPGDNHGRSSPSRSISGVSSHVTDGGSDRIQFEYVQPSLSWSSSSSRSIHSPEHHIIFHPSCSHHVLKVA